MPSLACIITFVVAAVCVLAPGALSGIILIQNVAHQGVGFLGKPLPNGLITSNVDITKAVPIMFDPTSAPFGIYGFGGGLWSSRHSIGMVVNNAQTAFTSAAHSGSFVASGLATPAMAVPTAFTASQISSTLLTPASNLLETAIFYFNAGSLEITARWVAPNGVRRTVIFIWDPVTSAIGAVTVLSPGLIKVRLFLIGSFTISNIVFDPHFRGFNGDKYDVQGDSDTWFNLITDHDVQINGFFQTIHGVHHDNNTYVRGLGMVMEGHTVYMNTTVVEVDGALFHIMDERAEKEQTLVNRKGESVATILCGFRSVTIQTPAYLLSVSLRTTTPVDGVRELFFNVDDVELLDTSRHPHGLMGQTANQKRHDDDDESAHRGKQGEGEIEGVYTDYKVSSAYGTDFKYNKFDL